MCTLSQRLIVRSALLTLVLVGCVGCDQLSKVAARRHLAGSRAHSYLGDTVRLQYAENPGAFLSLGATLPAPVRHLVFTSCDSALLIGLLSWAIFARALHWPQRLALAAVCAGGAGNVIDRIRFDGAVTDFLNLGIGPLRTGIFNVADVILILGLLGALLAARGPFARGRLPS